MRYPTFLLFCLAALPAHADDTRTPIVLSAPEVSAIYAEMRGFLEAVQRISDGLAENDMKAVAAAAHAVGLASSQGVPPALRMKLPMPLKEMGHATHAGFEDLASDAEGLGDAGHGMKQLSQTLQNCNACHASYRLQVK